MSCANSNCKISNDTERLLSCWLCDRGWHLKCVGFTGRQFDFISAGKGLRWTCPNCRTIDMDLFKAFKQSRSAFAEISKDLSVLTEKIKCYELHFKDFKDLDKLNVSLGGKRPVAQLNLNQNDIITMPPNPEAVTPVAQSVNFIETCTPISICSPVSSICLDSPPEPTLTANTHLVPKINIIPAKDTPIISNSIPPIQLVVVQPRKSIFVSRFSEDTTDDLIKSYIDFKLQAKADVSVYKFKFNYVRNISSFKVVVPDNLFDEILNSKFWPANTLVHEYINKDKNNPKPANVAVIPNVSVQKN